MKKWLLILAVGLTAASCQWWHETFDDVKECEEWYLDKLADTDDLEDFEEVYNDYTIWRGDLGEIDELKANTAEQEWVDDNEKKSEKIYERIDKLRDLYRD
jgi:hypothetical protein